MLVVGFERASACSPALAEALSCSSGIGCECVLFDFIVVDVKDRNLFLLSRDERGSSILKARACRKACGVSYFSNRGFAEFVPLYGLG